MILGPIAFNILLGALAALPVLSIDISAPTLVLLPDSLQTTQFVAGLTLSLFMVGFALGQVAAGSHSDRRGRRPSLLIGLLAFAVAGFACAAAPSGPVLVLSRMVQGFGAGACSVLSFAIVQDLFEGEAARRKRVFLTMIFGVIPIFAPALGSLMSDLVGWRAVYAVLGSAGTMLLLVVWAGVGESRPPASVRADAARLTGPLYADRYFLALGLANALGYGAVFAYIAGSPVVVITDLGLSSTVYAAVFAATAVAITVGAWSSGRLVRRGLTVPRLLTAGFVVMAGTTIGLAVANQASVAWLEAVAVPLLFCMLFARGVIAPNLQHLAIERQRARAGVASAALGVSQLLFAACSSATVAGLLPRFGPAGVVVPMALLTSASLAAWLLLVRPSQAGAEGKQQG